MTRSLVRLVLALAAVGAGLAAGMALLKRAVPSVGDETSDEIRLAAIGEGRSLESRAEAFRGGKSLTVMGATRIDLRNATLAPGGARLELQAYMSAVKVLVPESWLVRTEIQAKSSAVENRSARADQDTEDPADLFLTGLAVASAVAVANKAEAAAAEAGPLAPANEAASA